MRHRTISAALAAVVCAAVVAACGGAQDVAKSSPDSTVTGAPTPSGSASTSDQPSSPSSPDSQQLPSGFGSGPAGRGLGRFYHQHVSWTDCGGGDTCADIWVPLDYKAPNGPAITIKAKRDPAADQSHKVGSLFINPGGPGASGIDYLGYANFDSAITNVYDVIGFDPRGVASSTPIDCVSDSDLDAYLASDPTPDTPAEISAMQKMWAHFTAGCVARSGPLLQHV
jgi:pimeloyl-ACP methyl ester carboxylesterase